MTYQSSPYFPNLFPDEAYRMNRVGIQPLKVVPSKTLQVEGGIPNPWFADARKMVMAGLETNKRKEKGMLGHMNTTVRSQRYARPASRSAIPNGHFPGMEYTSAGLALRGGGNTETAEGRRYIQNVLLKRRVEEYKNLKSGVFTETATTGVPPPMNPETVPLDVNITQLGDILASGIVPSKALGIVKSLAVSIYNVGTQLTANQIAKYLDILNDYSQQIVAFYEENFMDSKESSYATALERGLERVGVMLELFAETAEEPMERKEKQKAIIRRNFLDLLEVPEPTETASEVSGEQGSEAAAASQAGSRAPASSTTSGHTGASSWNFEDW